MSRGGPVHGPGLLHGREGGSHCDSAVANRPDASRCCNRERDGDVETHREIAERLRTTGSMRRVAATVIPKLMGSTLSANLVNVLRSTGPSCTASAACAGGNYSIAIAASWIETGVVDAAIAGGVQGKDPHVFAGFDSI